MQDLISPLNSPEKAELNDIGITFVTGRPPNFAEIVKVFPHAIRDKSTIFTYGKVIYVSDGADLPRSIVAHETVHVAQQEIIGRDQWWQAYLADVKFRFEMEVAAHRIEHAVAMSEGNHDMRRKMTALIAKRLSGPLYGRMCTYAKAKQLLKEKSKDVGGHERPAADSN